MRTSQPGPCMSSVRHVALVGMFGPGLTVSFSKAHYHTITRCGRHLARKRGHERRTYKVVHFVLTLASSLDRKSTETFLQLSALIFVIKF